MRTEAVIVGSGPSGLLLGQLLAKTGVDAVILEQKSEEYVEQGAAELIEEARAAGRLRKEGLVCPRRYGDRLQLRASSY
jgi:p-hydroxybenzoate 3-monooxygenase